MYCSMIAYHSLTYSASSCTDLTLPKNILSKSFDRIAKRLIGPQKVTSSVEGDLMISIHFGPPTVRRIALNESDFLNKL